VQGRGVMIISNIDKATLHTWGRRVAQVDAGALEAAADSFTPEQERTVAEMNVCEGPASRWGQSCAGLQPRNQLNQLRALVIVSATG
jgi:hypothetical protein